MDIEILKNATSNSSYIQVSLQDHEEIFKNECLSYEGKEYLIPSHIVESICSKTGIPKSMNKFLKTNNMDLWIKNIIEMYKYYYQEGIIFLVKNGEIVDFTTKSRVPLLHEDFLKLSFEIFSDYEDSIELAEYDSPGLDTRHSLLFYSTYSDYKVPSNNDYRIGFILSNDELDTVTCRLAVKINDVSFYLPSKYYNLSAARYDKRSEDSKESFRLLCLRVIEDMLDGDYLNLINELENHLAICKKTPITYEEYRVANRLLSRVSVNSEMDPDESSEISEELKDKFIDFESEYPTLEEKESAYLWRCTAVGVHNMYELISAVNKWLTGHKFYPNSLVDIRETLGGFLVLEKISTILAKRRGE